MIFVFIAFLTGWFGVFRWFNRNRNFNRLGGLILMTALTYMSFEITLWSFQLSLPYMMVIGLLPVAIVAYGFRYYDHKFKQEKSKREEKHKNESDAL